MNSDKIKEIISTCFDKSGCKPFPVTIRWSKRFTRRIADATYFHGKPAGTIRLSTILFPHLSIQQQTDTIRHETAHLLAYHIHGPAIAAHGTEWQQMAVKVGASPKATIAWQQHFPKHTRKMTWYKVVCDCTSHMISKKKYTRALNNKHITLRCTRCNGAINLAAGIPTIVER